MKAIVIASAQDLQIVDVPVPEPGTDQVLVRVRYVGICGSDLHYHVHGANGAFVIREPLIPGHEMSGTIELDPQGEWAPGTTITLHPATFGPELPGMESIRHLRPGGSYLGSASTWPHTQGAMVEIMLVRRDMIRLLPERLPLQRAALTEPLSVALHALTMAGDLTGRSVLVIGAGPIGLLTAFAAQIRQADSVAISDVLPQPLQRANRLGVHHTYQTGLQDPPDNAFDVVLECTGVPAAISSAVRAARPRGTVVQVGNISAEPIPVVLACLVSKVLTLVGTFRFDDEIDEAIPILAAHPEVESVITQVMPASQVESAFAIARDCAASGKVLVEIGA